MRIGSAHSHGQDGPTGSDEDGFSLAFLAAPKGRSLLCGLPPSCIELFAREFEEVIAVDTDVGTLRVTLERAAQYGLGNVRGVVALARALPFADNTFDVVSVVHYQVRYGSTERRQVARCIESALLEYRRVLRIEGTFSMCARNRQSAFHFVRSWCQRRQASSSETLGTRQGPVTCTLGELRRLLSRCGLNEIVPFGVVPDERSGRYTVTIDHRGAIRFLVKIALARSSMWVRVAASLLGQRIAGFAWRLICPSWLIFASHSDKPRIALRIERGQIDLSDSALGGMVAAATKRHTSLFLMQSGNSANLSSKYTIPRNRFAAKKLDASSRVISALIRLNPDMAGLVPAETTYRSGHGMVIRTEGIRGRHLRLKDRKAHQLMANAIAELCRIEFSKELVSREFVEIDDRHRLQDLVSKNGLNPRLREFVNRRQVFHCDLQGRNIIHGPQRDRVFLLDFEHVRIGAGILNWYDFLVRNAVLRGDRYPLASGLVFERFKLVACGKGLYNSLRNVTRWLLLETGTPVELHRDLLILYVSYMCQNPIVDAPESLLAGIADMAFEL